MTDAILELTGITKRFGPLLANDDVSLHLQKGEILALLGENGAGKTTLMNILFGHYAADAGEVRVNGRRFASGPAARRHRGWCGHGASAFHPCRQPDRHRQYRHRV